MKTIDENERFLQRYLFFVMGKFQFDSIIL